MLIESPAPGYEIPQGLGDASQCSTILASSAIPGAGPAIVASNPSLVSACWCNQFPFMCSAATNEASQALLNPDLIYGAGQPIQVAPNAPAFAYSAAPPPANAVDLTQQQSDAQIAANQAAASAYMNQVYDNVQGASGGSDSGLGLSTWGWIAIAGVAVLGLSLLKK